MPPPTTTSNPNGVGAAPHVEREDGEATPGGLRRLIQRLRDPEQRRRLEGKIIRMQRQSRLTDKIG